MMHLTRPTLRIGFHLVIESSSIATTVFQHSKSSITGFHLVFESFTSTATDGPTGIWESSLWRVLYSFVALVNSSAKSRNCPRNAQTQAFSLYRCLFPQPLLPCSVKPHSLAKARAHLPALSPSRWEKSKYYPSRLLATTYGGSSCHTLAQIETHS